MPPLVLAWRYLTGRAAAAQWAHDDEVEWPPHPDRVFQALVAAWGERGESDGERAALEWLERLPPPRIAAPRDPPGPSRPRKHFVPVNDKLSEKQPGPDFRERKARSFPAVYPGPDARCALYWPDAPDAPEHREALRGLAREVTAIGHSSSLVAMHVSDDVPAPDDVTFVPAEALDRPPDRYLRVFGPGRLDALRRCFAGGGPEWRRPPPHAWAGYVEVSPPEAEPAPLSGPWIVLRLRDPDGPPLTATLALTRALRGALLTEAKGAEARRLLSGHAPDGPPLEEPHAAFLPLPFVGFPHADGHVMGLAVALPRTVSGDAEWGVREALGRLLQRHGGVLPLRLAGGRRVEAALEDRFVPPRTLRRDTWARSARRWASATPVVLDRYPTRAEARRLARDAGAYAAFAADQVVRAVRRLGLPAPEDVRVGPVSALQGVPAARSFPPAGRDGGPAPWHVHVDLRFPVPVEGPLLVGRARYRGYGLLRPLEEPRPSRPAAESEGTP